MASRYWVGGAGTWTAIDTSHWATSSGGASGASVPTSADDVFLDGNSGSGQVLTSSSNSICRNLDCTGFTGTLRMANANAALQIYGFLKLVSGMTWSNQGSSEIRFEATDTNGGAGYGITSAGKTLPGVQFNGVGGKWVLQDVLNATGGTGLFTLAGGNFDSGNFAMSAARFLSTGSVVRVLDLGTSTFTLTSATTVNIVNVGGSNLTVNASNSTIVQATASAVDRIFVGGGFTWGTLTHTVAGNTGKTTISGGGSFAAINFSDASNARTLVISGADITIRNRNGFNIQGTAGKLMTVQTATPGAAKQIISTQDQVVSYASLQDLTATGGGTFYAVQSTNVSGNTGWIFVGQLVTLGLGATSATIEPVTVVKQVTLGRASSVSSGRSVTVTKTATLGRAAMVMTAEPLLIPKRVTLSAAAMVMTAEPVGLLRTAVIGVAVEDDEAEPLTKRIVVGAAVVTDSGIPVTVSRQVTLGGAAEADLAQSVTRSRAVVVGRASETDDGRGVSAVKLVTVGHATEADGAVAVARARVLSLVGAVETDAGLALSVVGGTQPPGPPTFDVGQSGVRFSTDDRDADATVAVGGVGFDVEVA